MSVVQEIGDEAAATRGPHLVGIDGRHDGGHHVAGAAVAVQLLAVFVVVVQHVEDVACETRRTILVLRPPDLSAWAITTRVTSPTLHWLTGPTDLRLRIRKLGPFFVCFFPFDLSCLVDSDYSDPLTQFVGRSKG